MLQEDVHAPTNVPYRQTARLTIIIACIHPVKSSAMEPVGIIVGILSIAESCLTFEMSTPNFRGCPAKAYTETAEISSRSSKRTETLIGHWGN
jgi:hypothetical protein